ncbi:O-antigen ligase family protein [Falsihalocynthiibacter sp. S25ZX9]|uniref:O-antigen ligase family protein n=1 Tax=Falsihalocynthiibacter sp. S25ZX9 TaxID=3240870 RepID=UPI00350F7520
MIATLLMAFALLRKPEFGVVCLVAIPYSNLAPIVSEKTGFGYLFTLNIAMGLGLLLVYSVLYGDKVENSARFVFAFSLWVAAVCLSIVFAPLPKMSAHALRSVIPSLVLAITLFSLLTNSARITAAFNTILAVCTFFATLTTFQFLLGMEGNNFSGMANGDFENIANGIFKFRPSGPANDPNYYSLYLLPGVALGFYSALHSKNLIACVVAGYSVVVITSAILLTASRGAFIALAIVCFILILKSFRTSVVLLIGAAALAIPLFLSPEYLDRIAVLFKFLSTVGSEQVGVQDSSVSGRLAEMHAAWIVFTEHPWTGIGYGQFQNYYQSTSFEHQILMRPFDRSAHSLYLEAAAEQGLFGLLALLLLVTFALIAVAKSVLSFGDKGIELGQRLYFFGVGILGVLIGSIFLHDAFPHYFWVLIAISFACERLALPIGNDGPLLNAELKEN